MSPAQTILAYLISFGIPGLFLLLIYTMDLYASRTFKMVLACFAWGGIGGLGLAFYVNSKLIVPLIFEQGWNIALLFVLFAPIAEEILKSLVLGYLLIRDELTYFVDGAIYGFAAGIGFSITENILYMYQNPESGIGLVLVRSFSTCLMHGTAVAFVGTALGRFSFQRRSGTTIKMLLMVILSGWVAAILLHAFFNGFSYAEFLPQTWAVPIAVVIGLVGVGVIARFIAMGLREQKEWMAQTLDKKVGIARVTQAEVRAVQDIASLEEILEPILERFPKQADWIRDLILAQGKMGIKLKLLERESDPKERKDLEEEVAKLEANIINLRKKIGSYVMMYVRAIFPEGEKDVLEKLEQATLVSSPELRAQWQSTFAAAIDSGADAKQAGGLFAMATGRVTKEPEEGENGQDHS